MSEFNTLDWVILVALLIGFVNGFRKGLIMSLSTLLGVILGIWLAINSSTKMQEFIQGNTGFEGPALPYISFLAVFVIVYLLCYFGGKALASTLKLLMLGIFDKIAGGVFGLLKTLLFSSLVFLMINFFGFYMGSEQAEKDSALFSMIKGSSSVIYPAILEVLPDNRPDFLDKLLDH